MSAVGRVTPRLLLIIAAVHYGFCVESSKESVNVIKNLLETYDKEVRPSADMGEPTRVNLDFFINSISEINEVSMDYSLNLFFRQRWRDSRLAFTALNHSVLVHPDRLAQLWTPDVFFKNEKSGKFNDIMTPNTLFKLSPDGGVLLSQRVMLKLACPMDLGKFPLDNQTCVMEMESYSYTTADLTLTWQKNPVQWDERSIILPDFTFMDAKADDCTAGYVTGTFSCLRVTFYIQRKFGYYLTQLYIPSILIVILSWVSFWIDVNATPARVSLGLLTVLTMTTQSARFPTPRVSYFKALDIWSSMCLVFVFGGLLEYAIVNVMARRDKEEEMKAAQEAKRKYTVNNTDTTQEPRNGHPVGIELNKCVSNSHSLEATTPKKAAPKKRGRSKAEQVDYISRFLFPFLFIAFNTAYWLAYQLS